MRGGERRKSVFPPFQESGAIREEARKSWGFSTLSFRRESFAEGLTGGGRGAGNQRSRRGGAKPLARIIRLGDDLGLADVA